MFARLARIVTRYPWWVIGVWVAVTITVVLASPTIASVTDANQASFLPSHYESAQAQVAITKAFPRQAGDTELLVVQRSDGATLTTADKAQITSFATQIKSVPGVTTTFTNPLLLSPGGKVEIVRTLDQKF